MTRRTETAPDESPEATTATRPRVSRTTITPAPGTVVDAQPKQGQSLKAWVAAKRGDLDVTREPLAGAGILRLVMSGLLFLLCLVTLAGALLMLLLWQQDRDAGVLTTQIDRTWQLFDHLRTVERLVAFGSVPIATAWMVLATLNVRRATGQRRNPAVAAATLPAALFGIWVIGAEIVAPATDWVDRGVGLALQSACVVLPLLALERVADACEARHRPARVAAILAIGYLVHLAGLGAISNIEPTSDPERWSMLGIYLVIGALVQALGALAVNETARAIEEATGHRHGLRSRFSENVLSQAGLDR